MPALTTFPGDVASINDAEFVIDGETIPAE